MPILFFLFFYFLAWPEIYPLVFIMLILLFILGRLDSKNKYADVAKLA